MSKQAAYKLAHGALNVVWEKLKTFDFLGVDTQASPSPLGFSGAKIKWVDQSQASNPFEIIHISRPGKGDGEILEWVPRRRVLRGKSKPGPVTWEKRGPESDGETLAFFAEYVGQHTKTRKDIRTWFEAVDLDDYVNSRRITPNRARKSMPDNLQKLTHKELASSSLSPA